MAGWLRFYENKPNPMDELLARNGPLEEVLDHEDLLSEYRQANPQLVDRYAAILSYGHLVNLLHKQIYLTKLF